MKSSNECPKCNSNDIIRIPGKNGAYGVGNNIQAGFLTVILVTRYLCCGCGYSEEWIDNKQDIDKLRNKYVQKNN